MANWISSKLKAAETLLQHIDQQAAESLGKNEKQSIDDQLVADTSSKVAPETKSLIKDQLKKKSTENVLSQNILPNDTHDLNRISKSNSDVNQNDEDGRSLYLNSKSNSSAGITDNDWTELLSVPDKRVAVTPQSSNRLPVTRVLKKNGKKARNPGQGLNLSVVEGRAEKVGNNGVLNSSRKLIVRSESNISADSDEKASIAGSAIPGSSGVQFLSSGGESNQQFSAQTPISGAANMGNMEGMNDILDEGKLSLLNNSDQTSQITSIPVDRKLDFNVGLNGGDRLDLETATSVTNRSKLVSRTKKKVSSLPSEEDSISETDTTSSDSESEREREERRKRKQQILAEKAAAKAIEAIKDRENLLARLEGEKQSLEKNFEERAKQQVQEASDLHTTMMETMEAVELEKQKHNNTRMEALAQLAKLESVNADLARSFANVQKSLEVEADRIAELRLQIHMKEASHEEWRSKLLNTHQSGDKVGVSKAVEFELEMLEAEYSFVTDKVARMQAQVVTLETSIETTRKEIEDPSEVEIELKLRLSQLTDHLIQKQAQVETLSSEKAMLLLRIEAVSKLLDEHGPADFPSTSSREELEQGTWQFSNSKLRSLFRGRVQSGQQQFGSLVRQLDSLFCTGAIFLKRNSTARAWGLVYLVCLHLWVVYILRSHSPVSDDVRSGAVISLENINNTGGI